MPDGERDDREREPAEPDSTIVRDATPPSADPEVLTLDGRRRTRLADTGRDHVSVDALPKPLTECGCGECTDAVDPLEQSFQQSPDGELDMTVLDALTWAKGACEEPRPLTVERAGEVFRRYARANLADPNRTSRPEDAQSRYATIMAMDRHCRREYGNGLTTAMCSFRISPVTRLGSERKWITPLQLADVVNLSRQQVVPKVRRGVRRVCDDAHYVWLLTGTEKYATPHYHVYLWADDPQDNLRSLDFSNAVDAHTDGYQASTDNHEIDPDGDEGVVTIHHDPETVDTESGTTAEYDDGDTLDLSVVRRLERAANGEPYREATKGALYVATQLPYLAALDDDPHPVDCQTAAIKWCHNSVRNAKWFGRSQFDSDESTLEQSNVGDSTDPLSTVYPSTESRA